MDALRNELADDRRNAFFSSYMRKAQQRMSIEFSQDAIKQILGGN
jgi:hypothetical protein